MNIQYTERAEFPTGVLERLFLSVNWASGAYPERLAAAIRSFDAVSSAWDGPELIGLAAAMDDGEMTAYIHYVLVRPDYQGHGVGTALMRRMLARYRNYLRIALIAVNEQVAFYEHLGFTASHDKTPMFLTSLWD